MWQKPCASMRFHGQRPWVYEKIPFLFLCHKAGCPLYMFLKCGCAVHTGVCQRRRADKTPRYKNKKKRLPDSYHQVHLVPSLPFGSSCKVQFVLAVFFIRRTLVNVEVEKQDETKRGTGHPCENLERKRLQCRYGSPSNLDVALTSRELNMSLAIHFLFLHFVPTTHYLHM